MKKEIAVLVLVISSIALVSANANPVIQNTDVGHYSKSNLESVVIVDGPAVPIVTAMDCDIDV